MGVMTNAYANLNTADQMEVRDLASSFVRGMYRYPNVTQRIAHDTNKCCKHTPKTWSVNDVCRVPTDRSGDGVLVSVLR